MLTRKNIEDIAAIFSHTFNQSNFSETYTNESKLYTRSPKKKQIATINIVDVKKNESVFPFERVTPMPSRLVPNYSFPRLDCDYIIKEDAFLEMNLDDLVAIVYYKDEGKQHSGGPYSYGPGYDIDADEIAHLKDQIK